MRYKWCSSLDMQWFLFQIHSLGTNAPHTHTYTHTNVQNEFWPKSSCVLTKGSPDPESGMRWFRLWFSCVCLCLRNLVSVGMCYIHASPVVMCQSVTSWCAMRGSWLPCSNTQICTPPMRSGGRCCYSVIISFVIIDFIMVLFCNHLRVTLIF